MSGLIDSVDIKEPIHLVRRDRIALGLRLAGALLGFIVLVFGFTTSSWSSLQFVGIFSIVLVGGALPYYLLTSIVQCPSCSSSVANFRIGSDDTKRKVFTCARCGTRSWLSEGFYWQSEFSG